MLHCSECFSFGNGGLFQLMSVCFLHIPVIVGFFLVCFYGVEHILYDTVMVDT